jgi:hypothetical protein
MRNAAWLIWLGEQPADAAWVRCRRVSSAPEIVPGSSGDSTGYSESRSAVAKHLGLGRRRATSKAPLRRERTLRSILQSSSYGVPAPCCIDLHGGSAATQRIALNCIGRAVVRVLGGRHQVGPCGSAAVFPTELHEQGISGLTGDDALPFVCELGIANFATGVVGTASRAVPSFVLPTAISAWIFCGVAGVRHLGGQRQNEGPEHRDGQRPFCLRGSGRLCR